jgi:hypothetical protein
MMDTISLDTLVAPNAFAKALLIAGPRIRISIETVIPESLMDLHLNGIMTAWKTKSFYQSGIAFTCSPKFRMRKETSSNAGGIYALVKTWKT